MIQYGRQWIRANAVGGSRSEVIFWPARGLSYWRQLGYPAPFYIQIYRYIPLTQRAENLTF